MELATVKRIVAKLNENEIEASVYPDYSGRGMYGNKTAGVDLRNSYDLDEARKLCRTLGKVRSDNLGMGLILY